MGRKKKEDGIVAIGEATGHFHKVVGADVYEEDGGTLTIDAPNDFTLTHQEHGPITVPAKKDGYVRDIVREFDPFAKEIRKVID